MLSFFPRGVLDEILNLIESVSEGFPSYSYILNDAPHIFGTSDLETFFKDQNKEYIVPSNKI